MHKVTPLHEILPELYTGNVAMKGRSPEVPPADLALCHWVQTVDPDRLTYPALLPPGVRLKSAQAVARLQEEARWVIDCHKGLALHFPARFTTGALTKDLKALQELVR